MPRYAAGTIIDGRYRIRERLGAGGFGVVYRAEHLLLGRPVREVALKVLAVDQRSSDAVEAALGEAVTVLSLTYRKGAPPDVLAHMVDVYDLGVSDALDGIVYVAMTFVDGGRTLAAEARRFRNGGMPVPTALRYLSQILVPLVWIHAQDYAHGDLKPTNVLIAKGNRAVLADFGLAASTLVGVRGGTVPYQSAAQLAGAPGGPKDDIFAFGVIAYELLAGRHPWRDVGADFLAAGDHAGYARAQRAARFWPIAAVREERREGGCVPRISAWNRAVEDTPRLEELIYACLAPDPAVRPRAADLRSELEALQRGEPGHVATLAPNTRASALFQDARLFFERGNVDRARERLRELLAVDPRHVAGWLLDAQCLVGRRGQERAFEEALRRARECGATSSDIRALQVRHFEALGRPDLAEALRAREAEAQKRRRRRSLDG